MECAISDTLCPNSTMQTQDRVTFYREDEETPDINHPKSNCCKTQRDGYPKLGRPSTPLLWHHFADIWSDFMEWGTDKQGSKNSISVWAHLHCHSLGSSVYRKHPWHLLLEHNTLFQTHSFCKVIAEPETWWCALTPGSLEDGTASRIFLLFIYKAGHKEDFVWKTCPIFLYWRIIKKLENKELFSSKSYPACVLRPSQL